MDRISSGELKRDRENETPRPTTDAGRREQIKARKAEKKQERSRLSQEYGVLYFILKYGSIDDIEAVKLLEITQLHTRVHELQKKLGFNLKTEIFHVDSTPWTKSGRHKYSLFPENIETAQNIMNEVGTKDKIKIIDDFILSRYSKDAEQRKPREEWEDELDKREYELKLQENELREVRRGLYSGSSDTFFTKDLVLKLNKGLHEDTSTTETRARAIQALNDARKLYMDAKRKVSEMIVDAA